jgi:hypothetical protein
MTLEIINAKCQTPKPQTTWHLEGWVGSLSPAMQGEQPDFAMPRCVRIS